MAEIKPGDTVVSRTDHRGLRWRVTAVRDGWLTAERRRPGHVPVVAIYRTEKWRKR